MSDLLLKRSAVISDCGLYRYRLDRDLGKPGKVAAFIMVNPSTADADIDDATIRKLIGFSERLGFGRFIVGNKFAFRATDIKALRQAHDPIGPQNDAYLCDILAEAEIVICAWGPLGKLPPSHRLRFKRIVALAREAGKPLHCFGTALDSQPLHPLMLAYATPLVPWVNF